MAMAKVFRSGNSQAVRLPKEFRFPPLVREVSVRRSGDKIVLEAKRVAQWPEEFWSAFGDLPDDFGRPRQLRQKRRGGFD